MAGQDEPREEIYQGLLTLKEVFVYKVPPLSTAAGHRAEEWGLADPLFTGSLKMAQADVKLRIELFTPTGEEFGTCPIQVNPQEEGGLLRFVESVVDSSRYFVLRLVDKHNAKRTAMIGIGFRERDCALDFKSVLNEYVRYVDRSAKAEEGQIDLLGLGDLDLDGDSAANPAMVAPLGPSAFAMKEGEKIRVAVKAGSSGRAAGTAAKFTTQGGLAPPPPPGSTVFLKVPAAAMKPNEEAEDLFAAFDSTATAAQAHDAAAQAESEDWGDFS